MALDEKEQILIGKIVEGDEKAFSILFFNYLPVLQRFALKFTKSEEAMEEIIQDAFLRIWLNRDKLQDVENIRAYLYRYVSNECLTYLRKTLKETKIINTLRTQQIIHSNSTEDSVGLNEIRRLVGTIVYQMPPKRKQIYQMSRQDGKSIPEIAETLKVSPNTVKNTLVEALKTIREGLEKEGIVFVFLISLFFLKRS